VKFPGLSDSRVLPPAVRGPFDQDSQRWLEELTMADYDPLWDLRPSRLKPISCGRLAVAQEVRRTGVGIPVIGYLLETPEELIVVDCGLSSARRDATEVHVAPDDSPSAGTTYVPELHGPSLAEQVAEMGLHPDRLICTHLHEDHSSGAADLGLPVGASAGEWASVDQPGAEARGYPVDELAGLKRQVVDLDPTAPVGPFAASARVNADVIALDTAGHTPGSISLWACLGAAWALICGDAVYPRMDDSMAPAWFGMLRIRRALDDNPGLRLFPAHDTTVLRTAGDAWLGTPGRHIDHRVPD
jgi:glyoxylase-like metal-dependent hydrolase (beta-lactamase superfamily II)